jgi:potassium voltage-gated channel Shal-related subfamily D protein
MTLQSKRGRRYIRKDDKIVTLNVSGRKFCTWESTLKKYPNTLLGSEALKLFFDHEKKEYFLDRDPHMFRYILNYYKVGKLHLSVEDCVDAFQEELQYFGISVDEINDCCYGDECVNAFNTPNVCPCSDANAWRTGDLNTRIRGFIRTVFEATETKLARCVQGFITALIYISVITTIIETIECGERKTCADTYPREFFIGEAVCMAIFTVEYAVRLYAAEKRLKFIINKMNVLDLLAIIPFYIQLCVHLLAKDATEVLENASALVILRILRMFRILKLSRHSKKMRKMGHALKRAIIDLGFLFFAFLLANVLFASILYLIEKDVSPKQFTSIPDSMWYTIVTMMTVG